MESFRDADPGTFSRVAGAIVHDTHPPPQAHDATADGKVRWLETQDNLISIWPSWSNRTTPLMQFVRLLD
jgi:hypothetical protein